MDTTGELTQKKFSARQLVSKVFETECRLGIHSPEDAGSFFAFYW